MNSSPAKPSRPSVRKDVFTAFGTGLLLGAVTWALAELRQGDGDGLAAALVFVLSACASFVCYRLSLLPAGAEPGRRRAEVRGSLCAIGIGMLGGMQALNFLLSSLG